MRVGYVNLELDDGLDVGLWYAPGWRIPIVLWVWDSVVDAHVPYDSEVGKRLLQAIYIEAGENNT